MNPAQKNRIVRRELDTWLRLEMIDDRTHQAIAERYVTTRWDWRSLGRWFLLFGALSMAAGAFLLLRHVFSFTLEKLAVALGIALVAAFAGAQGLRRRSFPMVATTLELLGGLLLIGLTFTLGIIFSTGSGNWPALLLVDLLVLLGMAYLLNNILLLILSAVIFFTWFGGMTGYVSGWSMYWFGMSYPLRFLAAAIVITVCAVGHLRAESGPLARYRGFFKVWLSTGLFFGEMALWLLSLFGNYGDMSSWHLAAANELLLFNALWALVNGSLLYTGITQALRMLVGYGATFLIIQSYTLFFAHLADDLGVFLSFFLVGTSALGLVILIERWRRHQGAA